MHRIALVPYRRDWSYDFTAQALAKHLSDRFEISVFHDDSLSSLNHQRLDLAVDFWWKGGLSKRLGGRVLTQVSSHRWARDKYGSLDAATMLREYQHRAGALLVPSERLRAELAPHFERSVAVCPKGFHPETFGDAGDRRGDFAVGWAGNETATDKNLELLKLAWPDLRIAGGKLTQAEMPGFYNGIDVITCASDAEGDPRPLIEGMACGCFPIVVDVGIVPELVRHGENGLIVERSAHAFAQAFEWCAANLDFVRKAGRRNAIEMLGKRTWKQCAERWAVAFDAAVASGREWQTNARTERVARVQYKLRERRAMRRM